MVLKSRRLFLGLAIAVTVFGTLLFGLSLVKQINTSTDTSTYHGGMPGTGFSYGGLIESYNIPPQMIVGTSGIEDLMILNIPWHDFNEWVCHHLTTVYNCTNFGGGNWFNITLLYTYLQANQSQVAYSQTIVDQNISLTALPYHVANWKQVTIVTVNVGPGQTRDYGQTVITNQTTTYPLLGYTEQPETILALPNVSIVLIVFGAVSLVFLEVARSKADSARRLGRHRGSAPQKCPKCGGENLFFAEKCNHCGHVFNYINSDVEGLSH
jgi:hypothetical protein